MSIKQQRKDALNNRLNEALEIIGLKCNEIIDVDSDFLIHEEISESGVTTKRKYAIRFTVANKERTFKFKEEDKD